jgi:hypothetical protein
MTLLLCSCQGSFYDGVCRILGIDNTDYSKEAAVSAIAVDDEVAVSLANTASIVCYGDSIITFDSFSDKASDYVDITLNYLSGTFYSRYSADKEMFDKFSAEYPELNVNALIPLADYENTVYTYFGGNRKATVRSTAMYSYLDKINAFVLVGQAPDCDVEYIIHDVTETENTYRLTVSFIKNNVSVGSYDFIFRKRDGGDPYIWRLSVSTKVYAV